MFRKNKYFAKFIVGIVFVMGAFAADFAQAADSPAPSPISGHYDVADNWRGVPDIVMMSSADVTLNGSIINTENFIINGNFLRNGATATTGQFSIIGASQSISAENMEVIGGFIMGDGTNAWNLTLNVNTIAANSFETQAFSQLVISPTDWTAAKLSVSGDIVIADGLYMGAASGPGSMNITSVAAGNTYSISADNFTVNGDVVSTLGTIAINAANIAQVNGDAQGGLDVTAKTINVTGSANSNGETQKYAANNINITDDVIGNVNMSAVADVDGMGNVIAGTGVIDIGGNVDSGAYTQSFYADTEINIAGDVSGNVLITAGVVNITGSVTGGQFGHAPGDFNRADITVSGVYYFTDDTRMQLGLNADIMATGGDPTKYEWNLDDALIKVGGIDTAAVSDLSGLITIYVDGFEGLLTRINVLESSGGAIDPDLIVGLAEIEVFFRDAHTGIIYSQMASLFADGNIYANLATMNSLAQMVARAPGHSSDEYNMAAALDDLIIARMQALGLENPTAIDAHYASVMKLLFNPGDPFYEMMLDDAGNNDALSVMMSGDDVRARDFVKQFSVPDPGHATRALSLSDRTIRWSFADQLVSDFIWQRYHDKRNAWSQVAHLSASGAPSINSFVGGMDWEIKKYLMLGGMIGYNIIDFGATSGSTLNVGAYGTARVLDWTKLYGTLSLAFHSLSLSDNQPIVETTDATMEFGALHRIFDTYASGRAYMNVGILGGYNLNKQSGGQDFMTVRTDNSFAATAGYELTLGKDIYFNMWSYLRPILKVGIEYDLSGRSNDSKFAFAGANTFREWNGDDFDSMWLRYGFGLEFSFVQGASISAGYEIIKNGDFSANLMRISGKARF
ncbi:MAG: hypothetical protein LBK26_02280 [Rickettsiales bacterium]|jgi:hypothetical protein|nr:hypothetical protein [Rickettsiales bacterium]